MGTAGELYILVIISFVSISWAFEITDGWVACGEKDCIPAVVPGTILTSQLLAGQFESLGINLDNVYLDDNLSKLPDAISAGAEFYTYTFKNTVSLPCSEGARWKLKLNGVNYRSSVSLGGMMVGETVGMFVQSIFDVPAEAIATDGQGGCILDVAILVSPPDHLGDASNGGQGGDHEIARNGPVTQFSVGWDWIQATPDRHTGIWDSVELYNVGDIFLTNPWVVPDFEASTASVQVTVEVSSSGSITADIFDASGENVASTTVTVSPKGEEDDSAQTVTLGPLEIAELKRWWPHTHGDPYLYEFKLSTSSGDVTNFKYGFREVEPYINPSTEGWAFRVNGEETFLQGGNWITTDQLLRYASDATRYHTEVSMHRDMGMNLLRVWGGGVTERSKFYEAADEMGMLVWQEFWMTGDNNGRWGGNYSFPDSDSVYLNNVRSVVTELRNHPSLLMYCGGNELYPDHENPKPSIRRGMQEMLQTLDPDRFFTPSSMAPQITTEQDPDAWDPLYSFANDDGPYGLLMPKEFYSTRNPGLAGYANTPQSINPELGSVGTPEYESMKLFLSPTHLASFPSRNSEKVDPMWDYHKYESYTTVFDGQTSPDPMIIPTDYDHIYDDFGGSAPVDTEEYCWRAQIVMYAQFKALFEGFSLHAWDWYAGVLFWKSQSPWPALRGGLYDYYLRQTGGFWGVRSALRDAVHVQLAHPHESDVVVVNKGTTDMRNLKVEARTYLLSGKLIVNAAADLAMSCKKASVTALRTRALGNLWPSRSSELGVQFLQLRLVEQDSGAVVSENSYFKAKNIDAVRNVTVGVLVEELEALSGSLSVKLSNQEANPVAFMVRLTLLYADVDEKDQDARVLPVFYSSNYITIPPAISTRVDMRFGDEVTSSGRPLKLRVDGFNVKESYLEVY